MTHAEKEAIEAELIEKIKELDKKRIQIRRQKYKKPIEVTEKLLALVKQEDEQLFQEWLDLQKEPIEEYTDAGLQMFPQEEREERF